MSKILKKTRMKWLPWKIQLQEKDNAANSFPTISRIASDNRTGVYSSSFDDNKVIVFESVDKTATSGVMMPVGLERNNPALYYVDNTSSLSVNPELTTDLVISGIVRKGIGDDFITFSSGQSLQPFRDEKQYAADATSTLNSFFATGSSIFEVGEGFSQPLWSKTKLEIDLTPSTEHSFSFQNGTSGSTGLNYPMAYWNHETKKYEGIGTGKVFHSYSSGSTEAIRLIKLKQLLEDQCIGFGESFYEVLDSANLQLNESRGQIVSNFGFPYHPKFYATSSNSIAVSSLVDRPFLIEKIVLEFSGAFGTGTTYTSTQNNYNAACAGFFILNQRFPFQINKSDAQAIDYDTNSVKQFITGAFIPGEGANNSASVRDIVSTLRICSFVTGSVFDDLVITASQQMAGDLNIFIGSGISIPAKWSGRFVVSGTVKNQTSNQGMMTIITNTGDASTFMVLKLQNSNRSGLFGASGRSLLTDFSAGTVARSVTQDGFTFNVLRNYQKTNPYLIQPGDRLIIGWQPPWSRVLNENTLGVTEFPGQGSYLEFAAAPAKLVIYGSLVSAGEEHHDTLNQLLTSQAIHESIG